NSFSYYKNYQYKGLIDKRLRRQGQLGQNGNKYLLASTAQYADFRALHSERLLLAQSTKSGSNSEPTQKKPHALRFAIVINPTDL
ncbi:MAG: hypothetical protein ACKVHG_09820, partial [Sphingomonadales bacterium]